MPKEMLTTVTKVPYNFTHPGPSLCMAFRAKCRANGNNIAGKNVCVIEYQPNWQSDRRYALGVSEPLKQHSEPAAFRSLEEALGGVPGAKAKVLGIYTERAPCQSGPGMQNCDQWLWDVLSGYRLIGQGSISFDQGAQTPVYYSFDYSSGGSEEIEDKIKALREGGSTDTTKQLKELLLKEAKDEHAAITKILSRTGEPAT